MDRDSRLILLLRLSLTALLLALAATSTGRAADPDPETLTPADIPARLAGLTSEQFSELVSRLRKSVVVVTFSGRENETVGIGSGFVLSADGLIATNLHVIGEARPISIRLDDGRKFDVSEVFATDKARDLAIVRIPATELIPLEVAEPNELKQGQPVFALGNPRGLEHSVVAGIVSGFREVEEGRSLIQLAIPIEAGNSGGPLLDMQGHVHGLVTLKSVVTDNLGYATRAAPLMEMLKSPRPVPISRWLTIGALNPRLWDVAGDVHWWQRAGRILVDGTGKGFGGRSLCLSRQSVPGPPYEMEVDVKIREGDGAAGLVFCSDGHDCHYGFYPSSGRLRVSRFDGPTVYSWNVLDEISTPHFRPEDWNRLKVRVESENFRCYCNGHLVYEGPCTREATGQVGLAKFRHTTAEFRRFQVASELPSETPTEEIQARIDRVAEVLDPGAPPLAETVQEFSDLNGGGRAALREAADQLSRRAERLRQLATEVHQARVREELKEELATDEPRLLRSALLLASLDNEELIIADYERLFDQLAEECQREMNDRLSPRDRLQRLHRFLFDEMGFHGSRTNYYEASNSYVNETLDDREGLPITLSVLYLELARRCGLKAEGVGLPGHFIVRVQLDETDSQLVDVFDGGTFLTVAVCRRRIREGGRFTWEDHFLDAVTTQAIIKRMLRNLLDVANQHRDPEAALRYVRTSLSLDPESPDDRLLAAVLCYSTQRHSEGLEHAEWILQHRPEGIDVARVQQLREALRSAGEQ